jgi:hypothetical protein
LASDANTADANVKEVVRTALRRETVNGLFAQVAEAEHGIGDVVTFETTAGGLRQFGAVFA